MRKIRALLLALVLTLTLAACGQSLPAPTEAPVPESALRFSTVDREGKAVDESILSGHSLVMLNFWEPWCPPCVREMPELEKLYQAHRDQGLLIIGIYSDKSMEDTVDAVLRDSGTSYPILRYTEAFDVFQTGYVPTTVFVSGEGVILSELLVGSRDYAGWEELVRGALK